MEDSELRRVGIAGVVAWNVVDWLPFAGAVPTLTDAVPGVRPSRISLRVILLAAVALELLVTVVLMVICWFGSTVAGCVWLAETMAGDGKTPPQLPSTAAMVPLPGCPGTAP